MRRVPPVAGSCARSLVVLLLCAGCPKEPPAPAAAPVEAPVAPDAGPRAVDDAADLRGAAGVRATVVGTLERRRPAEAAADGTALVLADGTAVYVTEGAPPDGWEWLLGTRVRVQGTLWAAPEGSDPAARPAALRDGWAVPKLLEPEAPMPADVGMGPL